MANDKDENEWFDELAGGIRGFKRYKPVKEPLLKKEPLASTKEEFNYQPDIIDVIHIARRLPQAVLKIAAYGMNAKHTQEHLSYISREGELVLEDEKGNPISSLEEQAILATNWEAAITTRRNERHTAHMVLSTPPGSNRSHTLTAARKFLKDEFAEKGYHYLFVAHNDTQHPHVHACISMYGIQSEKLRLQPATLHYLRRQFAKNCREQGINIEASFRYERGLIGKSMKTPIARANNKGVASKADKALLNKVKKSTQEPTSQAILNYTQSNNKDKVAISQELKPWQVKVLKRQQLIRNHYKERAKEFYETSQTTKDTKMKLAFLQSAQECQSFARQLPHIDTRYDELQAALETHSSNNEKTVNITDEQQQQVAKALKEALGKATVTCKIDKQWQDIPSPVCQRILAITAIDSVLSKAAKHVRQPPVFIDADKQAAVLGIGHEKYLKISLLKAKHETALDKAAVKPHYQDKIDKVKCEIFSAAEIDNSVLLESLIKPGQKENKSLDKAINSSLQTILATQQKQVKQRQRQRLKQKELGMGWDD